jgi:hypothetical protein
MAPHPKKLLDQVRDALRLKHYSLRTEETYVDWITRFILFHNKRHPKDMGNAEVEAFLTHLAVDLNVAASTHLRPGPQRRVVPVSRGAQKRFGRG